MVCYRLISVLVKKKYVKILLKMLNIYYLNKIYLLIVYLSVKVVIIVE